MPWTEEGEEGDGAFKVTTCCAEAADAKNGRKCAAKNVTNIANHDGGVKMLKKMNKYYLILYFRIYLLDLSGLGHDNIQIYLHSVHIHLLLTHNCEGGEWCVLCKKAYDMLHDT